MAEKKTTITTNISTSVSVLFANLGPVFVDSMSHAKIKGKKKFLKNRTKIKEKKKIVGAKWALSKAEISNRRAKNGVYV